MIKVTYNTISKDIKKPEKTLINIFDGRMFIRYDIQNKAKTVVEQMKADGRKDVLYSRGCMLQLFKGKTEEDILEIAKDDIKKGVYVAEQKTGKKLQVKNIKIERR